MYRPRKFVRTLLILPFCGLIVVTSSTQCAADKTSDQQVSRLIRDLNSDDYATRRAATSKLIKLGDAALPQLESAARRGPAEVRARARRIIHFNLHGKLRQQFVRLAAAKRDTDVDLERGMWLISQVVGPRVKKNDLSAKLDALAARVREHLRKKHGNKVDPAKLTPGEAVATLRQVLFTELDFNGATENYDHPVNSSLYHVLKTRKGLPILLSHVVVAVGKRLKLPIVGVAIPGRYMCKYDGSRAPGGRVADIVINPFEGGKIMTPAGLAQWVPRFIPRESLNADGNRSAMARMLMNLASDYEHVGDAKMAQTVMEYRDLFAPRNDQP